MTHRPVTLVAAASLSLLAASCGGSGRPKVYPVSGTLTVKGAPAAGAFVVFHPRGDQGQRALKPYGQVGADGVFQLTTFATNDGAPEGEYAVTVVWPAPARPNSPDPGETGPDRLDGRFKDPARPVTTVTIGAQETALNSIDLK